MSDYLDGAEGRAKEAYRWATAEAEFIPLSTREHYGLDWPALVAELRAARKVVEMVREHTTHFDCWVEDLIEEYDRSIAGDGNG